MTLTIQSDCSPASAVLLEIAEICAPHGAQWHHELSAEIRGGAMRLLAPPATNGPLTSMPTEMLVPIAGAQCTLSSSELKLLQPPQGTTAVQRELLQLHAELYNATNKLSWWSNAHPARLAGTSPEVRAALIPLKPHFEARAERSAVEGFLATRSFGWRRNPEEGDRQPVLLPLIDLFNHHRRGAPFKISDGAMQIRSAQVGGSECFAHYGHRRDVLDLVLHYGHCDSSTPFAHSAPLEIEVEGFGRICVEKQGQRSPIHPFDPPRVSLKPEGLSLSHLCCHQDHPERVQMMLSLALQAHLKRRGHDAPSALQMAQRGLCAIGAANTQWLDQLVAAAQSSTHPGAATLVAAAQRQSAIIRAVLCPSLLQV